MAKEHHHLPYIQRLQRLNLRFLEKQRLQVDTIPAFGIFHGRYDLPKDLFFTLTSCSHLRGHDLKLRHRFFRLTRIKTAFLCESAIEAKLPPFVVNSPSMAVCKNRLDACREIIFGPVKL